MLDRRFVITIINTIDPEFFPTRVGLIMKERTDRYLRQEEDKIEVRTELLDMLKTYGTVMGRSKLQSSQAGLRVLSGLKRNSKWRPKLGKSKRPAPVSDLLNETFGMPSK